MKYIKNKLIIIFTLIVSVIFLAVMWNIKWKPLLEMTELGYLELEPVAKVTRKVTSSEGHTSTEYYVVVEVDTADGMKECKILMSRAYDEDDSVKNLENYKSKKKVAGYYFYMESTEKVLFSKEDATTREYMESKVKSVVIWVLALNIVFIVAAILASVTGRMGAGDLPKGDWTRDQMVVCRYNTFTFGISAMMLFAIAAIPLFIAFFVFENPENFEDWMLSIVFVMVGLFGIGGGIMFVLYMINYRVVFFPGGISYRNVFGKTWQYTEDQIKSVSYSGRNIIIRIKGKMVSLNSYCTNYRLALDVVKEYRI